MSSCSACWVVCKDIRSGELVDNMSTEEALGEHRQVVTS